MYHGTQSDIRVKSYCRLNLPGSSMLNFERRDRLLGLFGDPVEKLWSFVFAMGYIFILRASQQLMSLYQGSESNVMAVRICVVVPFQLLIAMIYSDPQSDIRVNTFARRNSLESSMLNFDRRDRFLAFFGDPVENYGHLY